MFLKSNEYGVKTIITFTEVYDQYPKYIPNTINKLILEYLNEVDEKKSFITYKFIEDKNNKLRINHIYYFIFEHCIGNIYEVMGWLTEHEMTFNKDDKDSLKDTGYRLWNLINMKSHLRYGYIIHSIMNYFCDFHSSIKELKMEQTIIKESDEKGMIV